MAKRIAEATQVVFGQSPIALQVQQACYQFEKEIENIQAGRGINALLIAIVGAKGQGKTWTARQLVFSEPIRQRLRSGDLRDDATSKLIWIGPAAPENIDPNNEIHYSCAASDLIDVGQSVVLLDTPGVTDANPLAAQIAKESLSLAPVKLLVIARDQLRAEANLRLARQIDGSICIPVITSVEPDEADDAELANDIRTLREQLKLIAPGLQIIEELKIPDFEITGDEAKSAKVLQIQLLDRLKKCGITQGELRGTRDSRLQSAVTRLRTEVTRLISQELPQLASAVEQLHREAEQLPIRVIESLLGSQQILETGIRIRLRTRLVSDTSLLWFPYRTVLSILNLTHGAWDRIVLALAGSVPSLFGALTSWAKNVRQSRDFSNEVRDGIRQRTQQQVEERLHPLCDQFHQAVMRLRPKQERISSYGDSVSRVRLLGMDQLQSRSQAIFDQSLDQHATSRWLIQVLAVIGFGIFWAMMAAPIFTLYRDYIHASWGVWSGEERVRIDEFPHPSYGLFFTSLLLSTLPLLIYSMIVLTISLGRQRIARIAGEITKQHDQAVRELQQSQIIRLQFGDELLEQAEFLLNLQ
ncbi:MAG: hypothetical protein U0930_01655 [Pirellulales bacterium]